VDSSPVHILEEMAIETAALSAHVGRPLTLIAESDLNDTELVTPREAGGYGLEAQWSDDFHHAVHAAFTGERSGYYADFGPIAAIAKSLRHGYVYDGQYSRYRGHRHGRVLPSGIPGHRLFGYVQDHDQVGNRALGERLASLVSPGMARVAAALLLTSPFTPMLFMGEEWGATTPWQYFTDHRDPELARAVREGRRAEFAAFGWPKEDVPDPQEPATFARSKLDWSDLDDESHAAMLEWHRSLIALRRSRPALRDGDLAAVDARYDETARWLTVRRSDTVVVANLAPRRQRVPLERPVKRVLLASARGFAFGPDAVELNGESVVIASC
jgi:maltooligosyltrehalose trehalohydrolase